MAIREPLVRRSMSPFQGWYSRKRWLMIASPPDAVRTLLRRPMMPREGIWKSSCTRSFLVLMATSSPLRRVTMSIILEADSSVTLIESISTGSQRRPSISFSITCGCPTCSSYPSRRMVSMSTLRCSTPRPNTVHTSSLAPFSIRKARLRSSSAVRRSPMWRLVTYLPSRPKNGLSLMVKVIDIVGSSIAILGRGSGLSGVLTVSPISKPSMPTSAHMSPFSTHSTFLRPMPSKVWSSFTFWRLTVPSRRQRAISWPSRMEPR